MKLLNVSDFKRDKLNIIDIDGMKIIHEVDVGRKPYPVDQVQDDIVFVSTRGERSVQPVNIKTGESLEKICLKHKPRSTSNHQSRSLALIGGVDKALTSLIDTKSMEVLFSVGSGRSDPRRDYGGKLASGHPFWIDKKLFLHFDRIERRVELYNIESGDLIDSVNTPSSVHHVAKGFGAFYGVCEGNRGSKIPPSVIKFSVKYNNINILEHKFLDIPKMSIAMTGAHHLTVDIKSKLIYVGTADSRMYTLSPDSLEVINYIDTGIGCGHVTLCPDVGLGVTTNHNDIFMTVFDISTNRTVGKIEVSSPAVGKNKTQGHTSKWFSSKKRLITTVPQEGKVIEIDPRSLIVTRECALKKSYLIQGCFVELD